MSLLIIGLICWLAIVVLVLCVLRAAGQADRAAERRARELGLAPAARVALAETMTRARPRVPFRVRAKPSWAAAAVTLTAVGLSVQQLGGFDAVVILAIAVGVGACLLTIAVIARRRGALIEHQARQLATQRDTILSLALRLLALHDPRAAQHAAAVAHHARVLARAAGLSERDQQIAHAAGLLHDIGLHPSADERSSGADTVDPATVRAHPLVAARLLRTVPGFEDVAAVVEAHHERIDGTGYPHGLRAEGIPSLARIIAIAELYDVLTAPDSYRSAHSHDRAAQELRSVTDTQLDAGLVELFLTATSPPATRPSLDDELIAARRMARQAHASAVTG
jgi:putative nucleotidyltransferase with HDIG domain